MALEAASPVVREIFHTVAESAPEIRAGLPGRRRKTGVENESDEVVMAADLYADELLFERLGSIDGVGAYASEEREDVLDTGSGLSVAVDPLDGSSNLKSNNPMGTIVGVYDGELPASGQALVAAGFVLYGPITTMIVAVGDEVTEYVVEDGDPREVDDVELPAEPVVYGFGGRHSQWPDDFEAYAETVRQELKLRYGGAMIADISQVLTYGGIFAYPALTEHPNGKLRLLFEGAPIAYLVRAAGGASSDGNQSLLDVESEEIHQRVPVHVGNEEYIERLEAALE